MIDKLLEQTSFADIERLVQDKWPEGKTVEYKREVYGAKDEDKRELLKDVSSFANTLGGDILIGVDEDKGVPTAIPGVALADPDKEKLRLEGIIRQGLEPRIEFGIHHVSTPAATSVIIIRVKESLLQPHRVVFQGKFGEFWARSSAGKFSMDTDELRRAFTLSDSLYEQIRAFRQSRVTLVTNSETPVPMMPGGKLLLHLIPVSSFRSRQRFAVTSMRQLATQFPPLGTSGWDHRFNLDGHVTYSPVGSGEGSRSYTQFFRNGIVESVLSGVVKDDRQHGKVLLAEQYERTLLTGFRPFASFLNSFRQIDVQPPIWGFLTITGTKGARIPNDFSFPDENRTIDRDVLSLPEFVIEELGTNPTAILRPVFDLVWNASGFACSVNFDKNGNWVDR